MDTLNAMLVFARVVEANSFSEAARRMGLSKSAVSKQVSALEDRLGARLLNRTTRRISPTEVGAALYERCARIASEVEEAELIVTRLHAAPRGRLRVNAPMSFGHLHLSPAMPEFLDRYPELSVDLALNDRFVDVVEEGYDVAIRITRLRDSSLIARKLAPARRIVCASPGYLARHGRPRAVADLTQHTCLIYTYAERSDLWSLSDGTGQRYHVQVKGTFSVNSGDALKAAAVEGLGITLLPTFLVGREIADGRLVNVFPDVIDDFGGIYAIYPHNRHLTPKVRALVDFLVGRFGSAPEWDRAIAEVRAEAAD